MEKRLEGKIALITGSSRGIGWATARLFSQHGATVLLNGRTAETLEQRAESLRQEFGGEVGVLPYDVSDTAQIRAAFASIFRQYKQLDILVNNAGILRDSLLGMTPEDLVTETMNVNVAAPLFHVQEAARLMGRKKCGSIINLSSLMGRVGCSGLAVYSTSKAAIIGMTLAAAQELGPKQIRVNAVAPGFIETDMASQITPEVRAERIGSIKMGRAGDPMDVARAILFLASEESTYITGQVLGVDGGMRV